MPTQRAYKIYLRCILERPARCPRTGSKTEHQPERTPHQSRQWVLCSQDALHLLPPHKAAQGSEDRPTPSVPCRGMRESKNLPLWSPVPFWSCKRSLRKSSTTSTCFASWVLKHQPLAAMDDHGVVLVDPCFPFITAAMTSGPVMPTQRAYKIYLRCILERPARGPRTGSKTEHQPERTPHQSRQWVLCSQDALHLLPPHKAAQGSEDRPTPSVPCRGMRESKNLPLWSPVPFWSCKRSLRKSSTTSTCFASWVLKHQPLAAMDDHGVVLVDPCFPFITAAMTSGPVMPTQRAYKIYLRCILERPARGPRTGSKTEHQSERHINPDTT